MLAQSEPRNDSECFASKFCPEWLLHICRVLWYEKPEKPIPAEILSSMKRILGQKLGEIQNQVMRLKNICGSTQYPPKAMYEELKKLLKDAENWRGAKNDVEELLTVENTYINRRNQEKQELGEKRKRNKPSFPSPASQKEPKRSNMADKPIESCLIATILLEMYVQSIHNYNYEDDKLQYRFQNWYQSNDIFEAEGKKRPIRDFILMEFAIFTSVNLGITDLNFLVHIADLFDFNAKTFTDHNPYSKNQSRPYQMKLGIIRYHLSLVYQEEALDQLLNAWLDDTDAELLPPQPAISAIDPMNGWQSIKQSVETLCSVRHIDQDCQNILSPLFINGCSWDSGGAGSERHTLVQEIFAEIQQSTHRQSSLIGGILGYVLFLHFGQSPEMYSSGSFESMVEYLVNFLPLNEKTIPIYQAMSLICCAPFETAVNLYILWNASSSAGARFDVLRFAVCNLPAMEYLKFVISIFPELNHLRSFTHYSPESSHVAQESSEEELQTRLMLEELFHIKNHVYKRDVLREFFKLLLFQAVVNQDPSPFPLLEPAVFKKLCELVAKYSRSNEELAFLLYALAIDDLGRTNDFRQCLNHEDRYRVDHDFVLSCSLKASPDLFPSMKYFSGLAAPHKYCNILSSRWNIGQFIQLETVPCVLRAFLENDKFSRAQRIIVETFGVACVKMAYDPTNFLWITQFLDTALASNCLTIAELLLDYEHHNVNSCLKARTIYNKYLSIRIREVDHSLSLENPTQYAISRLVLLSRMDKYKDITLPAFREAWIRLPKNVQQVLIYELSFSHKNEIVIYYAPAIIRNCVARAKELQLQFAIQKGLFYAYQELAFLFQVGRNKLLSFEEGVEWVEGRQSALMMSAFREDKNYFDDLCYTHQMEFARYASDETSQSVDSLVHSFSKFWKFIEKEQCLQDEISKKVKLLDIGNSTSKFYLYPQELLALLKDSRQQLMEFLRKLVSVFQVLHGHNIIHSNLSLANIACFDGFTAARDNVLLTISCWNSVVRIGHLSAPESLKFPQRSRISALMAPELDPANKQLSSALLPGTIDVWAIGIIAFCLLSGQTESEVENKLLENSERVDHIQLRSFIDQSLRDLQLTKHSKLFQFVIKCLDPDPRTRLNIEEADQYLNEFR